MEKPALQRVLAADILARLSRGFAGLGGGKRLVQYRPAHRRVLLEELLELIGHPRLPAGV